jgi:hypothetical protein
MKEVRARKLPLEISTSWWKCLGRFRPAAPQGASGGGQVHFGGRLVEMPPVSSPKFRPAGRRPFHSFRKLGPSAREFRPVHELANPEVLKEVYRGSFKYPVQRLLQVPCTEAPSSTLYRGSFKYRYTLYTFTSTLCGISTAAAHQFLW